MGSHTIPVDVGEGHIVIEPAAYDSIGLGTWALGIDANQWKNGWLVNTSHANGENISYKAYLASGTYKLVFVTVTAGNKPIVDFDIDGVEVASFDTYSAATIYNVINTQADISIATAGFKTIRVRVDGKNASATDYFVSLTCLVLWRTA